MATTRKVKGKEPHQPEEAAVVPKGEKNILKRDTAERAKKMLESLTREYQDVLNESADLFESITITHARLLEILGKGDDLAKNEVTKLNSEVKKLSDAANKLVDKAKAEKHKLESAKAGAVAALAEPAVKTEEPPEPAKGEPPAAVEPTKAEKKETKTENVKLLEDYLHSGVNYEEKLKVLAAILNSEKAMKTLLDKHEESNDAGEDSTLKEKKEKALDKESVNFLRGVSGNFERMDPTEEEDAAFLYAKNACEILSGSEESKPSSDLEPKNFKMAVMSKEEERRTRAKNLSAPAGVPVSLVGLIKKQLEPIISKGSVTGIDPATMTGAAREAAKAAEKKEPPKLAAPTAGFVEGEVGEELIEGGEGDEGDEVLTEDQKQIIDNVLGKTLKQFLSRDRNGILKIKIANPNEGFRRVEFNETTERKIMRDNSIVEPLKAAGISRDQFWYYFPEWLKKNGLGKSEAEETMDWKEDETTAPAVVGKEKIKKLNFEQKKNIAGNLRYFFARFLRLNEKGELIDEQNNKPASASIKDAIKESKIRPARLFDELGKEDVLGYVDEWLAEQKTRLESSSPTPSPAKPEAKGSPEITAEEMEKTKALFAPDVAVQVKGVKKFFITNKYDADSHGPKEMLEKSELVAVGDAHGSAWKILESAILAGMATMPEANAKEFQKIYKEMAKVAEEMDKKLQNYEDASNEKDKFSILFDKIKPEIETIRWIGGNRRMVYLGDTIADRGLCDGITLAIIKKFRETGGEKNISILASNHDFDTEVGGIFPFQKMSLLRTPGGESPDFKVEVKNYLASQDLFIYDAQTKTFFSHAPLTLSLIEVFRDAIEFTKEIDSEETLEEFVKFANDWYKKVIKSEDTNEIKLRNLLLFGEIDGRDDNNLLWSRASYDDASQVPFSGIIKNYVHGHDNSSKDSSLSTDVASGGYKYDSSKVNIFNLDNEYRKVGDRAIEEVEQIGGVTYSEFFALEKSGLAAGAAPVAPPKPPEMPRAELKNADENFVMRTADLSNLADINPDAIVALAKLFHEIFDGKTDEQVQLIKETNKRLNYGFTLDLYIGRDFGISVTNQQIAENLEKLGISLRRAVYYSSLDQKKREDIDNVAGMMARELRKWARDNNYFGDNFDDNLIEGSMFWDVMKYEAHAHGGSENRIKNPDAKKKAVASIEDLYNLSVINDRFSVENFIGVKAINKLSDDDLRYILDNCYFDASPVAGAGIGDTRNARLRQRLGVYRMQVWCRENVTPLAGIVVKEINFPGGARYNGEVDADDNPHGRGQGYWRNGNVYDGQFEHGKRSGFGRMIDKDGRLKYEGGWKDDLPHGQGTTRYIIDFGAYKEDRYLVGNFENGKPKGLMKIFERIGDPTPLATKDFTGDEDGLSELSALEKPEINPPRDLPPVPDHDPLAVVSPEFYLRIPPPPAIETTEPADELPKVDRDETPDNNNRENNLFFADEILEVIGPEKLKDVLRKFTTDTPDQVKQALKDLFSAPLNPVMMARLKKRKTFGDVDAEIEGKFLMWWKGNNGPDTENGAEVFYNAFQYQLISEIERQAAADPDLQAVEKSRFWSKGSLIRFARAILPGAGAGLAITTTIGTGGLSLFAAAFAGVVVSRVFRSGNVQLEREEKGGQKKKVEGGNWLTRLGRTISNKFSTAGARRDEVDFTRLRAVTFAIEDFKGKFLNRADNPEAAAEMMAAHLAETITEDEIKYSMRELREKRLYEKRVHVDALKTIAERAETRRTQAGEKQADIEAKGKLAEYLVAALDFNNDKMRQNEVIARAEREIAWKNTGLAVVWDEMKKGNLLNLGFGSGTIFSKEWLIGTAVEGAVVATTVAAGAAGTALTAGKAWWVGLLARAGARAGVAGAFGAFEGASSFGIKEKEEYARELLTETRQKLEEAKNYIKEIRDDEELQLNEEMEAKFLTNLAGLIAIERVADEEFKELKLFETAEGRRLDTEIQEFLAIAGRDISNYPADFKQKVDRSVHDLVSSRENQYKIAGKTGKKIGAALGSGAKRAAMVGAISAGIEGGRLVAGGGGSGFARIQEGEAKVFATSQKGDIGFFDKGEKTGGYSSSESSVAPAREVVIEPEERQERMAPEPTPTEPKVLATHIAGTGHDKGSLIGSMQAMQKSLTAENLAAIRSHHPQWEKLGDAKLIDRWRIEMARQHGQTFDKEGRYFKTVLKKGDVVSLVEEADHYPKIELNKIHTLARPHFVPRGGAHPVAEAAPAVVAEEAPQPSAARKLAESVNAGRTEVAGVELPAGSKITHADFNPDYPNLVDFSVVDANGNVQHHLYNTTEGTDTGTEKNVPVLERIDPFKAGFAKTPAGTESGTKPATSSYASRAVGVSGGGVRQGADVLGKEKLGGAAAVETALRPKVVGLADHLKMTDARTKYLFMNPKYKDEAADIINKFASQYVQDHPGVDLTKLDDIKNFEKLWKTESLKYFTAVKTDGGVVQSRVGAPEEPTEAVAAPKGKEPAAEPVVEAEKVKPVQGKPTSEKVVKPVSETTAPKETAVGAAALASKDRPIVIGAKLADGRHLVSAYNPGKPAPDKLFLPENTRPSLDDGLLKMKVNGVERAGELRLAKVNGAEKWVWDVDSGDQTDRYVLDKLDNKGYGEVIALPKED